MVVGFEERFQKEAALSSSAIRPLVKVINPVLTIVKPTNRELLNFVCFECTSDRALLQAPEYMPDNLTSNSAWVGGAILAKVVFPQNQHLTKADYDENGPSIIHRKCFKQRIQFY